MKISVLALFLTGILCHGNSFAQTAKDFVIISGRVTDFNGQPIENCSIFWQDASFECIEQVISDKEGRYSARIPKGKYQSMGAVKLSAHPRTAAPGLPESEQRLEFWAWNFIADRDSTLDIRYHRMEVYGLRVFQIPGAVPAYQIYVRPMSLTRFFHEKRPDSLELSQSVTSAGAEAFDQKDEFTLLAPPVDQLKATVWIDEEKVPVRMKQEIKEYFGTGNWGNAYLLTVDMPKNPSQDLPYHVFKVELTDLGNGDRGEALYYMEKENYMKKSGKK